MCIYIYYNLYVLFICTMTRLDLVPWIQLRLGLSLLGSQVFSLVQLPLGADWLSKPWAMWPTGDAKNVSVAAV